ncbi:MAG: hypothetical protein IKS55_07220 [Oscillospiraceae bacterium]|nr:hypothetical protein [Oscillospiraceae bacterium]
MVLTILLSMAGCALLFFGIWGVTVTMPTKLLAKNFPADVQERLQPRIEEWERQGMSPRRSLGWVILILLCLAYIGLFVFGGIDGMRRGFSFWQFFSRFLIIGGVIKAFDIGALDYFLLTKTHFFQHYFPETEGCAGWQDFGYNRRQQTRQTIMIFIGSIVTALIFTLLK